MIKIKICGITNKKEINYVNLLKPDYVGFVFTKSKREISGKICVELLEELNKDIKTVGVFRDNSIKEILDILSKAKLDVIQLHGQENTEFIKQLRNNLNGNIKVWRALSINDKTSIARYFYLDNLSNQEDEKYIDNFLIDGANPGSGESYSLDNLNLKGKNFFLAGGINEGNVLERIREVNPTGIDVSSGVEIIEEHGQRTKSFEKMKTLISKVRNYAT